MFRNPENMIKARIAETIVEEIFRKAGYQVYRFGYESVLQNLVQTKNRIDKKDEVGQVVASMPDFLVVKDEKPNFIEVKYRSNGKLNPNELKSWAQGRILLVFPFSPYFKISRVEEFVKTGKLYELDKDKYLPIPDKIIATFVPLIKKYLEEK